MVTSPCFWPVLYCSLVLPLFDFRNTTHVRPQRIVTRQRLCYLNIFPPDIMYIISQHRYSPVIHQTCHIQNPYNHNLPKKWPETRRTRLVSTLRRRRRTPRDAGLSQPKVNVVAQRDLAGFLVLERSSVETKPAQTAGTLNWILMACSGTEIFSTHIPSCRIHMGNPKRRL